jgi:hypothetical protein
MEVNELTERSDEPFTIGTEAQNSLSVIGHGCSVSSNAPLCLCGFVEQLWLTASYIDSPCCHGIFNSPLDAFFSCEDSDISVFVESVYFSPPSMFPSKMTGRDSERVKNRR